MNSCPDAPRYIFCFPLYASYPAWNTLVCFSTHLVSWKVSSCEIGHFGFLKIALNPRVGLSLCKALSSAFPDPRNGPRVLWSSANALDFGFLPAKSFKFSSAILKPSSALMKDLRASLMVRRYRGVLALSMYILLISTSLATRWMIPRMLATRPTIDAGSIVLGARKGLKNQVPPVTSRSSVERQARVKATTPIYISANCSSHTSPRLSSPLFPGL
ncbi:hypothetical protein DFP73DRAFT_284164 [Morchella snyderi]|nr:hypothetical protein DFP73DRAFT_284164 [Morchella snyderi]